MDAFIVGYQDLSYECTQVRYAMESPSLKSRSLESRGKVNKLYSWFIS
jgi:hypothetical protein